MALAIRIGIGLLLIVHGFAHYQVTRGWKAEQPDQSWLLDRLGIGSQSIAPLGPPLWIAALLALLLAGIVTMALPGWWRPVTIGATALSLVVLALFYQPAVSIGLLVDVGVLVALLWLRWPTPEIVGA